MATKGRIESLFEAPVVAAVVTAHDQLLPLTDEEARVVGPRWSEKRRIEFQAGRHCARVALREAAGESCPLPPDSDGLPAWPEGWTGSITHTGRGPTLFAAAVVIPTTSPSAAIRSIGLDAERDEPLGERLVDRILLPSEVARLETMEGGEFGRSALLVFSIKEAVYKSLFPIARKFLGFHEVETVIEPGTFTAELRIDAEPFLAGTVVSGRYVRERGLVISGASLSA